MNKFVFLFTFSLSVSERERATVFTNPAVIRDLFGIQTSKDGGWKGNALQNMRASSEFR